MSCRTGCPTKDHASWGDCARQMNLQIGDLTGQGDARTTDRRLGAYADARRQGLQPPSTKLADSLATVRAAGA
jgi:hypothetical protein